MMMGASRHQKHRRKPNGAGAPIERLLAAALRLHESNAFGEAEVLYRQALSHDPGHADALHLLGFLAHQTGRDTLAADLIGQAIARNPAAAQFHNNLGIVLDSQDLPHEAIASYRRALGLQPDYPEAHNNLGTVLMRQGKPGEAIAHYRLALASKPDYADAHNNLGDALLGRGDIEDAVQCFERAIALRPDYAEAHNNLGVAREQQGRLDAARAAFVRAIKLNPQGRYFYNLAELKHFAPADPDLAAMERLLPVLSSQPPDSQIRLHHALGKAYDDCGNAPAAFRHYQQAHEMLRSRITYGEGAVCEAMDRIAATFDEACLTRLRGHGDVSDVAIFIVGMPRSGSTLIEQILASHPRVFGAGERSDFPALAGAIIPGEAEPAAISRLAREYGARMRALDPDAARITDKTLTNFRHAGLIHLTFPNARIVHCRRNPADTCWSCYRTPFRDVHPYCHDLAELGRYYRRYANLMAHWRRVLPPSVLIDVDYESLIANPEYEVRRLLDHCGLGWDARCLAFSQTDRMVRTASAVQVRQPLTARSIGRWRAYAEFLQPLLQEIEGL